MLMVLDTLFLFMCENENSQFLLFKYENVSACEMNASHVKNLEEVGGVILPVVAVESTSSGSLSITSNRVEPMWTMGSCLFVCVWVCMFVCVHAACAG